MRMTSHHQHGHSGAPQYAGQIVYVLQTSDIARHLQGDRCMMHHHNHWLFRIGQDSPNRLQRRGRNPPS